MEMTRNERALHMALDIICDGLARKCNGPKPDEDDVAFCPVPDNFFCPPEACHNMTAAKWKEHLLLQQAKGYHGTTEIVLFTCPGANSQLDGDLPLVASSPD